MAQPLRGLLGAWHPLQNGDAFVRQPGRGDGEDIADYIGKHATDYPGVIDQLNDGKLLLNRAYKKVKLQEAVSGRPVNSEAEQTRSGAMAGPGRKKPGSFMALAVG